MTNSVTTAYLITSAFGTYIVYRFMKIFFDMEGTDRKIEVTSYLLYFFTTALLFLVYNNTVVNVVSNILIFFLITFNYEATLKRKLIATVSIYMILMSIEVVVSISMRYFHLTIFSKNSDFALISALIIIKVLAYIAMLLLSNFELARRDVNVSSMHWASIFIIPAGTLVPALMLAFLVNDHNLTGIIVSIIMLFLINIFVFYLYDFLMKSYDEKMEKALLMQQSNAYLKQLEIMTQSQENLKEFRHNVKNHVLSLKALLENNDSRSASDYLDNIYRNIDIPDEYSKSGNSEIDSILNYKLHKADACGIRVEVKVNVPEKLNILPFDLSVVLGNLLDNAIEASCASPEKKLKVSVELDRNVLYIHIANSFSGALSYSNGEYITTKTDKERHGMGLNSVKKSLEKYNGAIELHHTRNIFFADVLIYNIYESGDI